jgi:LPS-assembly lipoprotein
LVGGSTPMCGGKQVGISRQVVSAAFVLALGALTAACFQPLYGNEKPALGDSVRDKLAAVQVANIPVPNGHLEERLAVELRNQLIFDFSGGATPSAPIYLLQIPALASGLQTVIVDVTSGRPETQISVVNASFTLTEIASGKVVLTSSTSGQASFDIPGTAQRFAQQRAWLNAEDRALSIIADNMRNRLASYFVGGG